MTQGMMNVLIIIAAIMLILVIKSIYDARAGKARLLARLKRNWGDVPKEEYTQEKYTSIQFYYRQHKDDRMDIDDITWNDLSMDQIYMLMNNTCCAIGEEYLYALLRHISANEDLLKERNRLIELFEANQEARYALQTALCGMGKLKKISVYEYMNRLNLIPKESNTGHYLMAGAMLASLLLCFFSPAIGVITALVVGIFNVVMYTKRKHVIEPYFEVVSYIIRLLDTVQKIPKLGIAGISEYSETLRQAGTVFRKFRKGASVVAPKKPTGDLMDMFVDYARMLFHVDLIKFNKMLVQLKNNEETLNQMYEAIGLLDSMLAAASFRALTGKWCLPDLVHSRRPFLDVRNVYHPMLENPVPNSIKEDRCVLITGSNASGKSTFIKTLAINAILSQTIYTSVAEEYHASFFRVASSMALKDNIMSNESYYIVEIKSLKRILDSVDDEIPLLCFVDEVLRGTNTLERIAASSQILNSFAKSGAMCFAATHDIELTHILEKEFSNYHFQEQVEDNQVLFDYLLYRGRAVSRNAIKLLGIMGYSQDIIDRADQAANYFLEHGEWRSIQI